MTNTATLTGIYTLTPTHCGTGQAGEAVDLPIARESTTLLPILPATSLKGVARDALSNHQRGKDRGERADLLDWLFGHEIKTPGSDEAEETDRPPDEKRRFRYGAGSLVFGEGFLLAYPFRSLNRPLLFGTSLFLIERWLRICRAHGLDEPVPWTTDDWVALDQDGIVVVDEELDKSTLVLEEQVFGGNEVRHSKSLETLGDALGNLLPKDEKPTVTRLKNSLVLLPDRPFLDMIEHAPPVTARTQLTADKTTTPSGDERGNLWYEETLPPDCLFGCVVAARPGARHGEYGEPTDRFRKLATDHLGNVQIGGNETVGQGRCWWTVRGAS